MTQLPKTASTGKTRHLSSETHGQVTGGEAPLARQRAPDSIAALPSLDQLRQLPRWAIVAFLARCARMCQPLISDVSAELRQLVENAIGVADEDARFGMDMGGAEVAALNLMRRSVLFGSNKEPVILIAAYAAEVAALANMGTVIGARENDQEAREAGAAMDVVVRSASSSEAWQRLASDIAREFKSLHAKAASEAWSDDTKVGFLTHANIWHGSQSSIIGC